MPVPSTTPSPTAEPIGDGVLTIGTLFPTTGAAAVASRAGAAAVELAVREINEAGGVNGHPVVVYHQDSGDASTTKPEESFTYLVSRGVDVLIGPSSTDLTERLLPKAIEAGVVMISPSVTSPTLTSLKDDGLLFRTIPSEGLEGKALANVIGKRRVAIIYQSVDSDRAVRDELVAELEKAEGELVAMEGFSATSDDVDKIVSALRVAAPDAIVLSSPSSAIEKNTAILLALAEANLAGSKLWLSSRNLADYSEALPEGTLTDVNGILGGADPDADFQKRVKSSDPTVSDFRYAAEAYDATIIAALAALVAEDDRGRAIASVLQTISSTGITCTSFGECLDVLTTRKDINYDGVSGPLSFDSHGDPRSAPYGVYGYGADNKFTFVATTKLD
jgi:branched-chain amino acid transport system substrate-binding protein